MKRASLENRTPTKRSARMTAEPDDVEDFTDRILLSLVFDVTQLAENVERIKVQVFTMAKARGIVPPKQSDS